VRAVGVCGIGATEGAGPTLPPWRAVMWGMKQIPAALAHKNKIVFYIMTNSITKFENP